MQTISLNESKRFSVVKKDNPPYTLNALDRADCCGVRAVAMVTLKSGSDLYFCGHHYQKHLPKLINITTFILDERSSLVENRLVGSAN